MIEPNAAPEAAPESDEPSAPAENAADPRDQRIAELEALVKEKENKFLYLYAETENFKKRVMKERDEVRKFGWEPVATELLQVIDNLERAIAHMPAGTDKALGDGIHMVLNQFRAVLEKHGVIGLRTEKQKFDPNLHEAVAQEKGDGPEGTILQEHTRGYTMHGRLLRPARVTVSGG